MAPKIIMSLIKKVII